MRTPEQTAEYMIVRYKSKARAMSACSDHIYSNKTQDGGPNEAAVTYWQAVFEALKQRNTMHE